MLKSCLPKIGFFLFIVFIVLSCLFQCSIESRRWWIEKRQPLWTRSGKWGKVEISLSLELKLLLVAGGRGLSLELKL